ERGREKRIPISLFDTVYQRGEPLNPHFQPVSGRDRPHTAGRAGENDVAGQQGQVGRDETDKVEAVEDELAGVRVLPQLAALEELDGQIVRIGLRLHIRSQGREGV